MSLRLRLLLAIGLALLLSGLAEGALQTRADAASVRIELTAALDAAGRIAAVLPARAALAAFAGNRHVQARLQDAEGRMIGQSPLAGPARPPRWYLRLVGPDLAPIRLHEPDGEILVLRADPGNEVGERWSDFRQRLGLLGLFWLSAALLCSLVLAEGLRPLRRLADGLAMLGRADIRLPESGPLELASLTLAFNRLAGALAQARARAARLEHQLERLAEEERTEIARDLHDDIGPLLFAIRTFAASLGPPADPIAAAAGDLQTRVRDMLFRLHVDSAAPTLECLLEGLAGFWERIRPETRLALTLDPAAAALEGSAAEAMFRIAQESVANAIRHGDAQLVTITATRDDKAVRLDIRDDGSGGEAPSSHPGAVGYGLSGMRARAEALGGSLAVCPGTGWRITATLPLSPEPMPASGPMGPAHV